MKLEKIIAQTLEIDEARVNKDLTLDTCAEWTSFAQIELISALESSYGVTFDIMESIEMDSYSAIRDVLVGKGIELDD